MTKETVVIFHLLLDKYTIESHTRGGSCKLIDETGIANIKKELKNLIEVLKSE